MQNHFIITCEHASNAVPAEWAHLFRGSEPVLGSHRGWDPGALELAKKMADSLDASLHIYPWTRLLIELNRSKGHKSVFSEFTRSLPIDHKSLLLSAYWSPYRENVREDIQKAVAIGKRVIHISVHTFTPIWKGEERDLDIGLLYDPQRKNEQEFCRNWRKKLKSQVPGFRIRMNRPYLGSSDGHTTSLRKDLSENNYLGIEIEVNQKYWFKDQPDWNSLCNRLAESLMNVSVQRFGK